ncbi:hypothetical protein GCM10029976_048860 [Kribbella albertanoniae]
MLLKPLGSELEQTRRDGGAPLGFRCRFRWVWSERGDGASAPFHGGTKAREAARPGHAVRVPGRLDGGRNVSTL